MCVLDLIDLAAARRSRFGRHRPTPLRIDHTNELTGEARVFLLLSPLPLPLFRRPILVAGGVSIVVTHSSAPGLGVGQNRPVGRLFPRDARPRTRPGPARGPDPSGWSPACPRSGPAMRPATSATSPACKPAWADLWAGPHSKNRKVN